jgi:hypothetical protein
MGVVEIPVRNDAAAYRFQLPLEGRIYFFAFRFNTRMGRWIMDIENEAQEALILGIPILAGSSLLDGYTSTGLPPGAFVAIDEANKGRHPDRENFGIDLKLYYLEALADA